MNKHSRISIALCTYNGEKYLKQQLDSYVKQTMHPYELIACDDASSDLTVNILEEFSHTAPFPVRIFRNKNTLGLIKNFSQAASLCTGDYVAFSDHDDIWLSDRLEACFHMMRTAEYTYGADIPLLVHSDLCLIDAENHVITPSGMRIRRMSHIDIDPLKTLLIRNFVSGCTSLCNRVLINESLPFPDVLSNHDGWIALVAASRGKILYIPEPKVLYRQHASNASGRAGPLMNIKAMMTKVLIAVKERRWLNSLGIRTMLLLHYQAKELQKHLIELSVEVPPCLNSFVDVLQKGGMLNTFKLMFIMKVRQPELISNVFFFFVIANGNHIKFLKDSL